MFARLRRGRRARAAGPCAVPSPAGEAQGRSPRARRGAAAGKAAVCGSAHGWLLAPPAAAQEAGVLVAEKIDSGEKPSLSSCSRGCR